MEVYSRYNALSTAPDRREVLVALVHGENSVPHTTGVEVRHDLACTRISLQITSPDDFKGTRAPLTGRLDPDLATALQIPGPGGCLLQHHTKTKRSKKEKKSEIQLM